VWAASQKDAAFAGRCRPRRGSVAAATSDLAGQFARMVERIGVAVLVEGEDGVEPAAVDLVAAIVGQVGGRGP
jgi:hypothetical protein